MRSSIKGSQKWVWSKVCDDTEKSVITFWWNMIFEPWLSYYCWRYCFSKSLTHPRTTYLRTKRMITLPLHWFKQDDPQAFLVELSTDVELRRSKSVEVSCNSLWRNHDLGHEAEGSGETAVDSVDFTVYSRSNRVDNGVSQYATPLVLHSTLFHSSWVV